MTEERPKTVFCDIDGTLIRHKDPASLCSAEYVPELLEGTRKTILGWDAKGYNIILTTGRKESLRDLTEKQLSSVGIIYDKLLMGITGGDRILINDKKSDGRLAAWAITPPRNVGLSESSFSNLSVLASQYFEYFSQQNIEALSEMYADDVTLTDWDIDLGGKDRVIEENKNIFNSIPDLKLEVDNIDHVGNVVYGQITISAKDFRISVIDVIEFNNQSKIKSIRAYKR